MAFVGDLWYRHHDWDTLRPRAGMGLDPDAGDAGGAPLPPETWRQIAEKYVASR